MINVDITTKNTVYNTLGPQAQWIQHRFGRRDYPNLELDVRIIKSITHQTDDVINFISMFGDPSQHSKIVEILESVNPGKIVFNSHLNFDNNSLIDILNKKQAYVVVPCYGIDDLSNKILLHTDWTTVDSNIKKLNCTVCIEFSVFEHNVHQIPLVKNICKERSLELKIKKGVSLHPEGFSPVVNENKEWLYDVYSANENISTIKWPTLHQTVNGYNSLIQYIKPSKGKSILNKPNFYKIDKSFNRDSISISATGHVFPAVELHHIFSNSLCTDWNCSFSNITEFNKINIKPEYAHLCAALTTICNILDFNCLYEFQYSDILSNLTNSNV